MQATAGLTGRSAGGVENGINTVHLSYVGEVTGHALIGACQWIPAGHIDGPVRSVATALPLDLGFRSKGQLATDVLADAFADGIRLASGQPGRRRHGYAGRDRPAQRPPDVGGPVRRNRVEGTSAGTSTRLILATGLRRPVEEDFEFGKVRRYHASARHNVLVMAALAICAVTAALLKART